MSHEGMKSVVHMLYESSESGLRQNKSSMMMWMVVWCVMRVNVWESVNIDWLQGDLAWCSIIRSLFDKIRKYGKEHEEYESSSVRRHQGSKRGDGRKMSCGEEWKRGNNYAGGKGEDGMEMMQRIKEIQRNQKSRRTIRVSEELSRSASCTDSDFDQNEWSTDRTRISQRTNGGLKEETWERRPKESLTEY